MLTPIYKAEDIVEGKTYLRVVVAISGQMYLEKMNVVRGLYMSELGWCVDVKGDLSNVFPESRAYLSSMGVTRQENLHRTFLWSEELEATLTRIVERNNIDRWAQLVRASRQEMDSHKYAYQSEMRRKGIYVPDEPTFAFKTIRHGHHCQRIRVVAATGERC